MSKKKWFVIGDSGYKYGPLTLEEARKVSSICKKRYLEFYKAYEACTPRKQSYSGKPIGFITDDVRWLRYRRFNKVENLYKQIKEENDKIKYIKTHMKDIYIVHDKLCRIIDKVKNCSRYFTIRYIDKCGTYLIDNPDGIEKRPVDCISVFGKKGKKIINKMIEDAEYKMEEAENELENILEIAKEVGVKTLYDKKEK